MTRTLTSVPTTNSPSCSSPHGPRKHDRPEREDRRDPEADEDSLELVARKPEQDREAERDGRGDEEQHPGPLFRTGEDVRRTVRGRCDLCRWFLSVHNV